MKQPKEKTISALKKVIDLKNVKKNIKDKDNGGAWAIGGGGKFIVPR